MNRPLELKTLPTALQVSEATIQIMNLRLRTYVGFNEEELTKRQDIIINAEIRYPAFSAMSSDDESEALNYKTITKRMIDHVEQNRFRLLEKLAADLLAIASAPKQVTSAEVRVDKPHALRFADSVSVTLSGSRQRTHHHRRV